MALVKLVLQIKVIDVSVLWGFVEGDAKTVKAQIKRASPGVACSLNLFKICFYSLFPINIFHVVCFVKVLLNSRDIPYSPKLILRISPVPSI